MATSTMNQAHSGTTLRNPAAAKAASSVWLALGVCLWLFAVGGRWDLPFAAWLYSIFLLRFSRTSRIGIAVLLLVAASIAAALFWAWQSAVPFTAVTTIGCLAYGVVFALPLIFDRLLTPRLGPLAGLLAYPALLTACEFVLGAVSPMGTSYGLLAVTQSANLPLMQIISVTGPYAIGFFIGLLATVSNFVWEHPCDRHARIAVMLYTGLMAAVFVFGEARIALFPAHAPYVRVAGIAPSFAVIAKAERQLGHPLTAARAHGGDDTTERAARELVTLELFAATRRAAQAGAQVVMWSENAAAVPTAEAPSFLNRASAIAREEHIYLNLADNVPTAHDQTQMIDPTGSLVWTYQKAHPIPGLESYRPGPAIVPSVRTPFGRIANVICYDADFPRLMRVGADIMLVPGGDWPEMGRVHTLKMASLRAIENGYSLFRQDFNGLSAAFDHQGHVLAVQDTTAAGQHILVADLPTRGVPTIYRQLGDFFAWGCVLASVFLIALGIGRPRVGRKRQSSSMVSTEVMT